MAYTASRRPLGGSGSGKSSPLSSSSASSSPATTRRLMKEWQTILLSGSGSGGNAAGGKGQAQEDLLELRPWDADAEDLYEWYAKIRGPSTGCYAGGEFELSIQIPNTYPTKPPKMSFRTRIWHPNVHFKTGEICLDLLQTQWSPAWTLTSLCTAIIALLDSPEPSSPLNVDAANVLRTGDERAYRTMCRMYTALFAEPVHEKGSGDG